MMDMNHLLPFLLVPLILWRLYARVRRNVGRQTFSARRIWISISLFSIVLVLIGIAAFAKQAAFLALLGGAAGGTLLAQIGLKHTQFEHEEGQYYYTPHTYIGLGLIMLFVGRMLYRMLQLSNVGAAAMQGQNLNPTSLVIVGLMFAYYIVYAFGVLRWQKAHARALVTLPA